MYTAKMHHNFIEWADQLHSWGLTCGQPRTSGAQTGCHSKAGFLATGPRSLYFMAVYFKNAKVYQLQNMHMLSRWGTGHMTHLW